jgi:pimeloyl-ACP methyl ester carboxylesterase
MRELTLPGRLILIPGLGCTPAIFDHQRKAFGDRLETPAFIEHHAGESVAGYAQRWAKQLSKPGDDRPLFIGGSSFGGMLAQEMAMHLSPRPRAVFLIASTRTGDRVTGVMQLAELVGRLVPTASANQALKLIKLGFALREGLDDDDKRRLIRGAGEVDPAMTKWASGAAVGWPGYKPPPGYPPIHQIHSRHDWVIKPPTEQAGVEWVDGNRHLLQMTHAHTVNRFLFDRVLAHCPEANVPTPAIEDPDMTAQRRLMLEGAPAGTPMV